MQYERTLFAVNSTISRGVSNTTTQMLFTWDTENLCIIFSSWRITTFGSLIWSLVAVMALTAGYEAVREASRKYEARQAAILENMPSKCHHQFEVPACNRQCLALILWKTKLLNAAHSSRQGARSLLKRRLQRLSKLPFTVYKCSTRFSSCKSCEVGPGLLYLIRAGFYS